MSAARCTATTYFTSPVAHHDGSPNVSPGKVNVSDGHNYAWRAHGRLGIRGSGSAVRAGPVHYDDRSAVDACSTAAPSWRDVYSPGQG